MYGPILGVWLPSFFLPLLLIIRLVPPPFRPTADHDSIDKASQVLAKGVPPGMPKSYRALKDYGKVPRSTLRRRTHGGRSIEEKAKGQRYLSPYEDQVVVNFLLQMAHLGQPV